MLTKTQIFEIHSLNREGLSCRQISGKLDISRTCVKNYLQKPDKVVEKAVHYLRINFLPLRKFKDLNEANIQVKEWLIETANERIHSTTGEKPSERFKKLDINPLYKKSSGSQGASDAHGTQ